MSKITVAWHNDKTGRTGTNTIDAKDELEAKLLWRKDHPQTEGWRWITTWDK